jgi:hypothetical protein
MGVIGESWCLLELTLRVSSKYNLQFSGSRGFMLGDIFGLRAGLTRFDGAMLFLFFVARPNLESVLLTPPTEKAGLVGDETALSMGLGLP